MGLIVVDTTVLLYAVGDEHRLREPCRRLVDAVGDGLEATTTVEVIQEFTHVRSRRRTRDDTVRLARWYARTFTPLLSQTALDLADGLALFLELPDLGAFDAVLAATAVRHETTAFVSADRAFAAVPGLAHIAPGTEEFERLLSP